MDSYRFEVLNSNTRRETAKSVLKQAVISSVVALQWFMSGLCVGAPTVFIPQIRKQANSTDIIDDELGSWLYSTNAFAAYPWTIIWPLVANRWGLKIPQIAASITSTIFFTILYFSRNPYDILISEVFQGILFGGNLTTRILTIVDYTSPEYRGMFLAIKSASLYWGIWAANAIGTFYPWKYIAVLGFVCSIYTFNALFWPESPFWLAKQRKFDECKASYEWIHGRNDKTDKEVRDIILMVQNDRVKASLKDMLKSKQFLKPIILCLIVIIQYQFSGKFICSLYILDIFKDITKSESSAYAAMLILDGVTVFGMYCGSYLAKILNRRTLYFYSSFSVVFVLFIISLYLFLIKLTVLHRSNTVIIILLTLYSLSISCGPAILAMTISGELIPLKFQASCYVISGFVFMIFNSWLIKLAPYAFSYFGVHGTFLFYGITCGLCTVYLYFYLPETKNKTQIEISKFFRNDNKIIAEESRPLK